jgi:RNA polymerase sigma factor (sigma-70 family)
MISQLQAPEQPTARRATKGHNGTGARLDQSIPDHVDHVPHPEYLCPGTENMLFGPAAPTISMPQWRPSPELTDAQDEVELPKARLNLSRQDEALLFRRYNCARYHMAGLMEKQMRHFSPGRVPEILAWYRRVLENRAALTQANMALVVAMAKRTRIDSVEFGELVSEGNMALLRAVDKFDYSRGFKFSTYACCAILKAFNRLASKAGTYRQRFPTNTEPQTERSDESDRRHADQRELGLEDLRRVLILNRAGLTDVEQTVLGARFAVVGHDRIHTLREVSGLVRLSGERVRQVQNGALSKLRRAMEVTFSPATRSPGKANGAFEDLTATIPGRLGLGVLAAAECGT